MLNSWWQCSIYGAHAQLRVTMFNLWWPCSIFGAHAHFMLIILNLWCTYSIYGEHAQSMVNMPAQFIVKMHNLWWICSIYDEHAQFMVNMLILGWTYSIYGEHAQFRVNMLNLISWLDWPWKTTLKRPFECPNPSTVSKDTMKSAELYSQSQLCLTIGFALKNYTKMTLWLPKSIHWIKRYSDVYIEVSWFVQSQLIRSNYWIGLKKLPQNDSLNVEIRPLDQKLLICYIRSRKVIN